MKNNLHWAFFGTSQFSVLVLDEMKSHGFLPSLIITTPDKPKGRKLVLTPPDVKIWADKEGIQSTQLATLRKPESEETIRSFSPHDFDVFVVASYGKIIPQNILNLPKFQTLNIHPSLLPKLRGPSPMASAILSENETGVTIMRLDAEMDHGPILAQKKVEVEWPPYAEDLEKILSKAGGDMLADLLPRWINGDIQEVEQDHSLATYCEKIEKEHGLLDLNAPAETNLRKIRAFHIWPGAYFFDTKGDKKIRIVVKRAHIENGVLVLDRIVPEGKNEMNYADYLRGKK